jgi:large subunit ribosomal protein L10
MEVIMPNIVVRHAFAEYGKNIDGMGSCVVLSFDKLTVAQVSQLRNQFREEGISMSVVRNRIAKLALKEAGLEVEDIRGKCGIAFAPEEKAITAAKLVRDFAKANKEATLEILAGVVEGEVIPTAQAATIADMPDKNTVRAQILGCISGPARGLATVLSAVNSGLARCLDQHAEGAEASEGGE